MRNALQNLAIVLITLAISAVICSGSNGKNPPPLLLRTFPHILNSLLPL